MVFGKILEQLTIEDIIQLKTNNIPESDILDYKKTLIDDEKLVKHVSAFANTRGGYIIFGVKESGRGGIPSSIPGIDATMINKERMEQILLSNIQPRLLVRIKQIPLEDDGKAVLILQIPDSQYRPHQNAKNKKFYKRFEFEACEMTESEVCESYKTRFSTYDEVENYLSKDYVSVLGDVNIPAVISVIPTVLNRRLIDTSDESVFSWLDPNTLDFEPSGMIYAQRNDFIPKCPQPSAFGLRCMRNIGTTAARKVILDIHRNGCIQYLASFGEIYEINGQNSRLFRYLVFAAKIMHTLQFTHKILSQYNYIGDVRIRIFIDKTMGTVMPLTTSQLQLSTGLPTSNSTSIMVDREYTIGDLNKRFSLITKSIMNEVCNHYNIWKCHLFNEEGEYIRSEFER
ncbi:helix-turn-helix domain-containing protein [Thermoproteota archaeon]